MTQVDHITDTPQATQKGITMAIFSLLSYLGTKGVAATAAATLMVGGGVAIAQNGAADSAVDVTTDEVPEEVPVVPEEAVDGLGIANSVGNPDQPGTPGDEKDVDEVPEFEEAEEELEEVKDPEGGENGERSETAKAVHKALTGGSELKPGETDDEGNSFGDLVSEQAKKGDLGKKVSEAASGAPRGNGNDEEEENTVEDIGATSSDADAGPPANVGPNSDAPGNGGNAAQSKGGRG